MKNRYALFPFVTGALALICFALSVYIMASSVQPLWGRTAVLILPSLILCTVGIFAKKGILNARASGILTAALSSAVLLIASIVYARQ